jgi:hypothetical protein
MHNWKSSHSGPRTFGKIALKDTDYFLKLNQLMKDHGVTLHLRTKQKNARLHVMYCRLKTPNGKSWDCVKFAKEPGNLTIASILHKWLMIVDMADILRRKIADLKNVNPFIIDKALKKTDKLRDTLGNELFDLALDLCRSWQFNVGTWGWGGD